MICVHVLLWDPRRSHPDSIKNPFPLILKVMEVVMKSLESVPLPTLITLLDHLSGTGLPLKKPTSKLPQLRPWSLPRNLLLELREARNVLSVRSLLPGTQKFMTLLLKWAARLNNIRKTRGSSQSFFSKVWLHKRSHLEAGRIERLTNSRIEFRRKRRKGGRHCRTFDHIQI